MNAGEYSRILHCQIYFFGPAQPSDRAQSQIHIFIIEDSLGVEMAESEATPGFAENHISLKLRSQQVQQRRIGSMMIYDVEDPW